MHEHFLSCGKNLENYLWFLEQRRILQNQSNDTIFWQWKMNEHQVTDFFVLIPTDEFGSEVQGRIDTPFEK
jgi:hypothetical protein